MKTQKNRIYCLLLLLVTGALPFTGWAQFADGEGRIATPSTGVWNFVKYGNTPVNLHTGTVSVNIPLYTYKDKDIEIPISIGYASNGYIANERPGPLGVGWFLNAGGLITREVIGIPDEVTSAPIGFSTLSYVGYYHLLNTNLNLDDVNAGNFRFYHNKQKEIGTIFSGSHYETTPDIFHFNFMGYKGSFILGKGGNHTIFNTNFPAGEVKIQAIEAGYQGFRFIITTGDGYEYHFTSVEMYCSPVRSGDEYEELFPLTWHLNAIVMPNGRQASFFYQDEDKPLFSFRPEVYSYNYSTTSTWQINLWSGTCTSGDNESNINIKEYVAKPKRLSTIRIDDLKVSFNYGKNYPLLERDIMIGIHPYTLGHLESVTVAQQSNGRVIKNYVFSYKEDHHTKLQFLEEVVVSDDESYFFDYYDHFQLPRLDTYSSDHWGYYNGRNVAKYNFLPQLTVNASYDETVTGNQRDPDSNASKAGMLKDIIYPTGGKTTFEYQAHDYHWEVQQKSSTRFAPALTELSGTTNKEAGGLRIWKITDHPNDGTPSTREFIYRENNKSTGTLLFFPRYSIRYGLRFNGTYVTRENYVSVVSTSPPTIRSLDRNHIEYAKVIEKISDGSSTEYSYYTYVDFPDELSVVQPITAGEFINSSITDYVRNLMHRQNSRHHYRGLLKSKLVKNHANQPLLLEEYSYSLPTQGKEFYDLKTDKFYKYKIFTDPILLNSKTRTEYSGTNRIVSTTRYGYNQAGQAILEELQDSRNKTHRIRRQYIRDLNPTAGVEKIMKDNHVVRWPLKTVTTVASGSTEMLIGGSKQTYVALNSNKVIRPASQMSVSLVDPVSFNQFAIESHLTTDITYDAYDNQGNPLQSTSPDGVPTCYVWGYNGVYLLARIENATLAQITAISGLNEIGTAPLAAGLSASQETSLRGIAGGLVTAYTYYSYIGLASVSDYSSRKTYYEYDSQGRLTHVLDENNKIIEQYEYNVKPYIRR